MQAKNDLLEAALAAAAAGIAIFPVGPDDPTIEDMEQRVHAAKKPVKGSRGFKDATLDEAQIRAWWTKNPNYNIAFVPGQLGWSVVDLDQGAVGRASWQALQDQYGQALPTYEVETPRGGRHLYFEGLLPPSVSRIADAVDIRGNASYALLPPSVCGGRRYRALNECDIAPLPTWMPAVCAPKATASKAATDKQDLPHQIEAAIRWLQARPEVNQGDGADQATFRAAAMLSDLGLSPDKIVEVMLEYYKCQPQDGRYEAFIQRKVDNATGYKQNEAGAYASPLSGAEAHAAYMPDPSAPRKFRFQLYGEDDMDAWEPPAWLVPGWLPEVGVAVLYGLPGTLKTFLAVDLAMHLATGQAWCGRPAGEPLRTVYLPFEGPDAIGRERRPAWRMVHGNEKRANFKTLKNVLPHAFAPEEVEQFIADIEAQGGASLVVLDTWARFMFGLDENHARDAGAAVAALEAIRDRLHCLVLVLAHSSAKGGVGVRGSSALEGAVDTMIEVKREKGTLAVELWCQRQKNAQEPKAPLTFEARPIAGSLVLFPTDRETHKALTDGDNVLAPAKVGAALVRLGAVQRDTFQPTHILALELLPRSEVEDDEQHMEAVARLERVLKQRAKKALAPYCQWVQGQWLWGIPEGV